MIAEAKLFSSDPSHMFDFAKTRPSDIFNKAILPNVNSFLDLLGDDPAGLEDAAKRRSEELGYRVEQEALNSRTDQNFVDQLSQNQPQQQPIFQSEVSEDYNAPVTRSTMQTNSSGEKLKLSNYGYSSDSSPDYNSNVLRIGHANNKLQDGLSAALTKSLANRYGLKTGDMFEATTADGKTMRRRYDDTVPTKYKGRALPETVDLYELGGNNKFSGVVTGIRALNSK